VRVCIKNRAKLFRRALPLLFLAWAALPGQVRGQCFAEGQTDTCTVLTPPVIIGPYSAIGKTFIIKVYMHFIIDSQNGNDWIGQAEAESRAASALAALNAAFNPHGIFFASPGNTCGSYASLIDTTVSNIDELRSAGYKNEDGIDIYVRDAPQFLGWAFSIPSTYMSLDSPQDSVQIDQTYYLIHEMGHCLGLMHPFEDSCDEECGIDACHCTGDYICDTPPLASNFPLPCDDSLLSRNYMSYAIDLQCPREFTIEQAKRMHAHLESHPLLQGVLIPAVSLPGGTLSSPSGHIVVASGTQAIDSPLEMLPGASITVKKGAALQIKSAVSGACGQMWPGVTVEGDFFAPQAPGSQGKAVLQGAGALIQDAACGIRVQGGGIAEVLGGGLRNNAAGMCFEPYSSMSASRLLFADFSVDDDYRGSSPPVFLSMSEFRGLDIRYASFSDWRDSCAAQPYRAVGIAATEAGFRCVGSSFSALQHGIHASNLTLSSGSFQARHNSFADCFVGIWAELSSGYLIENNDFRVSEDIGCYPVTLFGVRLSGAAPGFRLRKNTFSQASFSSGYAFIGTHSLGLGAGLGNAIAENTYINLQVGNRASGDNGYDGDGLRYLCNDHILNIELPEGLLARDCDIAALGSIRREQANFDDDLNPLPAGNLFSEAGYTIYNANSSRLLDYYYDAADSRQDPSQGAGSVGVFGIPIEDAEAYCPAAPCPHPPCQELPQEDVFLLRRQQRDSLAAALPGISGKSERERAEQALGRARLGMSEAASAVLLHYALDTTEVQADSLLRWLELAETYGADYRRARHHFFSGQLAAFDSVWQALPARFSLDSLEQAERQGLDELFALLRPYAPGGLAQMAALPLSAQDSLKAWAGACSEPGFLAAVLLRRNGYPIEPDCQGLPAAARRQGEQAAAPAPQGRVAAPAAGLRVFPNPSVGHLAIELPESYESAAARLYSLHGRLAFQQRLAGGMNELYLPLPPGLYVLEVELPGGGRHREKIVLSR
jgi:hypothetical protein